MKILITGDSSRGKTTLAKALSKKISIPVTSTDDIYFIKKFTKIRPDKDIFRLIDKVFAKKSWIVEGTTRRMIERGLVSADLVIFCGHRHLLPQLWLALKRGLSRKTERLVDTFGLVAYLTRKWYRLGDCKTKKYVMDSVREHPEKLVELYSFKEIDDFVLAFDKFCSLHGKN